MEGFVHISYRGWCYF